MRHLCSKLLNNKQQPFAQEEKTDLLLLRMFGLSEDSLSAAAECWWRTKNPPRKSFVSNSANKNQVQGHFHPDAAGGGSARWELDSVAGARRVGRTGEMNSSDCSAFRALRVAVTPDNKGKYSEQGIALINIQCFFLFIYLFLVVAASSRAVNP